VDLDKILNGLKTLTPREHEVLNQVISGQRNREVASDLGITIRTVKEHRVRIMKKMEANSLAELVIKIVIARLHESRMLIGGTERGEVISDPATSSGSLSGARSTKIALE
jgi:DNA-binding CsgD family transcriptional regulator